MKRISILLVALLSLVVAACSAEQASSSEPAAPPAATQESTPEATEPTESTEAPEASTDDSGDTTALDDALPDELNGMARVDVPGLDAVLQPALAAQGVDASEVEFVFASYGEGTEAVAVNAFRVPDMTQPQLEMMARMMSGAEGNAGVEVETVDIGGKSVLQMTGAEMPAGAFMYFADGAVFTIISESADLAEQLLGELP